jgi:hypothetical protein
MREPWSFEVSIAKVMNGQVLSTVRQNLFQQEVTYYILRFTAYYYNH